MMMWGLNESQSKMEEPFQKLKIITKANQKLSTTPANDERTSKNPTRRRRLQLDGGDVHDNVIPRFDSESQGELKWSSLRLPRARTLCSMGPGP
mmetsp:Transcript_31677/g.67485  ORF Transcript_31677/g.67485 Transcript_31677/m.67485 type:complete len:94 (+) Transcript_31677:180-461(+)